MAIKNNHVNFKLGCVYVSYANAIFKSWDFKPFLNLIFFMDRRVTPIDYALYFNNLFQAVIEIEFFKFCIWVVLITKSYL